MACCRVFGEDKELSDLNADGQAVSMSYKNAILFQDPVTVTQDGKEYAVHGISYDYDGDLCHLNETGRKMIVEGIIDEDNPLKNPYQELMEHHHNGLEAIVSLKWMNGEEAIPLDHLNLQNLSKTLLSVIDVMKKDPRYHVEIEDGLEDIL